MMVVMPKKNRTMHLAKQISLSVLEFSNLSRRSNGHITTLCVNHPPRLPFRPNPYRPTPSLSNPSSIPILDHHRYLSLSLTHSLALFLCHTLPLSIYLTLSLSLSLSRSHSRSLYLCISLSLSLSLPFPPALVTPKSVIQR